MGAYLCIEARRTNEAAWQQDSVAGLDVRKRMKRSSPDSPAIPPGQGPFGLRDEPSEEAGLLLLLWGTFQAVGSCTSGQPTTCSFINYMSCTCPRLQCGSLRPLTTFVGELSLAPQGMSPFALLRAAIEIVARRHVAEIHAVYPVSH